MLTETTHPSADSGESTATRTKACPTVLEVRFQLGNESRFITPTVKQLTEPLQRMNLLPETEQLRIGIALQEALSNAIHHGNLELDSELRQEDESIYYSLAQERRAQWPYCERQVHVFASFTPNRVKYVIRDEGPGFDPLSVRDATSEENIGRVGGRGLMLIRSFIDDVRFNQLGNQITLVKYTLQGQTLLSRLANPDD